MATLYQEIGKFIHDYETENEFNWDDYIDGIEKTAQKLFPDDHVDIFTWEVDNDTFEIDRAFDEIIDFAKDHTVIDHAVNWDLSNENIIITIIHRG